MLQSVELLKINFKCAINDGKGNLNIKICKWAWTIKYMTDSNIFIFFKYIIPANKLFLDMANNW